MDVGITKRCNAFRVSAISNGFVVEFSGENNSGEWQIKQFYCPTLAQVRDLMQTYFELEES